MSAVTGFTERVYRAGHLACGIGGGAKGFNKSRARVGNIGARLECAGGIDVDADALRNFEQIAGVKGTLLDFFDTEQYCAFHGHMPPAGWREATPHDVRMAFGGYGLPLDVAFASFPCKGFSGLLSQKASETPKYEALNRLTLRGIWLLLEAYKDDPVKIILFENVPRISTRGKGLLRRIKALLQAYGYVFVGDKDIIHDCGELGNLAQSRKRFLLIARHVAQVPNFIYQPPKHRLRGVGEVIGKLPLPGDPIAGPMHRIPELQWKTWVRLAFVPPGRDWRALNDLRVENGVLADYGILPDQPLRDNALGVLGWDDSAPTLTSARAPGQGRFSVADPRPHDAGWQSDVLGVNGWDDPTGTVPARSGPTNGAHSVADPRPGYGDGTHRNILHVTDFDEAAKTITAADHVTGGASAVADPRVDGHEKSVQLGVRAWEQPAPCVKGDMSVGTGPYTVADPRIEGKPRFNNIFRIVAFDDPSPAVAGPGGPAGGIAVADPRPSDRSDYKQIKYKVTPYDDATGTVIGASTTGNGAFAVADPTFEKTDRASRLGVHAWEDAAGTVAGESYPTNGAFSVADPRPTHGPNAHQTKHRVVDYDAPSPTVTGSDRVGSGAMSVADPRPNCLNAETREGYETQGHYGVVGWDQQSRAVPGYAKYDRGPWAVAEPREMPGAPLIELPKPADRLVCRIVARDGTWHRPFTTLELGALQSLFDPEEIFHLEARSDSQRREWIGNMVPPASAQAMGDTILETLLLADLGETFTLSSREIWAKPLALALSLDPRQPAFDMDEGRI